MIVAGHQPDLFPYSGFWYKLAKADIFDLKIWDQFLNKGFQKRVLMREKWANLPISASGGSYAPIFDKRINPTAKEDLASTVEGRYRDARYWKTRGPAVIDLIMDQNTDRLWQFNLAMILGVRDMLGIKTPIAMSHPTVGTGAVGLVSVLKSYGKCTYLSGTGARGYMGDCSDFTEAGIDVIWSAHKHITPDSVLSIMFDHAEPMDIIMLEHENELVEASV